MSNKSIVKIAARYFLAVLVTIYLWQFAGKLLTAKNDIENVIGSFVYFAIVIIWLLMLKNDVMIVVSKLKKQNKSV